MVSTTRNNTASIGALERATGYKVTTAGTAGTAAGAGTAGTAGTVRVEVPGAAGGPVEMSLAALEQIARSYVALRGDKPAPANAALDQAALQKTLLSLKADLNKNLFDDSPLRVTDGELLNAHKSLMTSSPAQFSALVEKLDDGMLNAYLGRLAEVAPFEVDLAKGQKPAPSGLAAFATKVALEMSPDVAQKFVARLDDTGKRKFMEGVLNLPSGALVERLRDKLGADAFSNLAHGGKVNNGIAGGGLVDGRVWKDNVTGSFQESYAAAKAGTLALPPKAKDAIYMMGPGLFGDQLPGYLEPNMRALAEWGVPKEKISKLRYNTAVEPDKNADDIYAQIKGAYDAAGGTKKIVVIGHSKFGRDMLEAFHRHPDLKQMVQGAVMMQPALTAPIADDLGKPVMAGILNGMLDLVGGNRGAFSGLSEKFSDLPHWPTDVPTVTMASSTESPKALLAASAQPYYEHAYNLASDGAVAYQDQVALDGSFLVSLPGVADHAHAGLTFRDAMEHFAKQLDAGAPDDVIAGMMARLEKMVPNKALLDGAVAMWKLGHHTPEQRAKLAHNLREIGPALDRFAHVINQNAGHPLIDVEPMTKALVAEMFTHVE